VLLAMAAAAEARTRQHYGGTLRVETAGDPWAQADGMARRLVFDGLTAIGSDGGVRPALAVSWTSEDGFHRWQFRLRAGVRFHDGSALTSTAVAASLIGSCGSACPWGAVRAVGTVVVFTSDEAMPNLPVLLATDEFLIVNLQATGALSGTGPFAVSAIKDSALALIANGTAWSGRPFLDAIEIHGRRAISDQWLDISLGRADVADVPVDAIKQAQQQKLQLVMSKPVRVFAMRMEDSGSLSNQNVRAAIAHAVDRMSMTNVIFQKQATPTGALLPQGISGYAFLFPPERDLNKARELRGGLSVPLLTLEASASGWQQLAAQRVVLNLREAGINAQVVPAGGRRADMLLLTLRVTSADGDADLEQMIRASGETPAVPIGEDAGALHKAEREALDLYTIVPLADLRVAYAVGGRVRDFRLHYDGAPDLASASLEAAQ
jgi:ABC-type transport system substrate-binding protein